MNAVKFLASILSLTAMSIAAYSDSPTTERSEGKAAGKVAQPVGLFVCRGPNATPEREVNFPFIDGWLVRPGWDKVEPKDGEFDWSFIDSEIALAKKLGKKVTICVLGGPQTPAWVFKAGAKEFAYTMPVGPKGEARIPLLWDEVYLKKWTALIRAFGKKYSGNDTVALIHMTGATANGLEMMIPFMPNEQRQWEKLGYTSEKEIGGWKKIIDSYAEAFPSKPLDIDIHPVLRSDKVAEEVTAYASKKLGTRFGVFGGWLSGRKAADDRNHAGMHALAEKYGKAGFSAWQMIRSQTKTPGDFADGGLKAAVEQGLSWNGKYFEIWETDATNEKLHSLLKDLSAMIKK